MESKDNKAVVTRDMPSKGEGQLTTYSFPKLGVSVEATSLQEAQVKAEAKHKAINSKDNDK